MQIERNTGRDPSVAALKRALVLVLVLVLNHTSAQVALRVNRRLSLEW